ncbi:DUF3157 family protein [uncultured Vibrio sp.]|uniref:DUF3157 family protein n=1 Tax=uncultured Vibrio sp. TaxID=114054 RepID=UPI0026398D2C|nr:DUF3157 family protein [uncultured Vibrio sp.]
MKSCLLLASALLANSVWVSSALAEQVITLPDGKQVLLKDDFTWQYVAKNKAEEATATMTTRAPAVGAGVADATAVPVATVSVASKTRGTTLVVDGHKPRLELSQSGVDVVLGASHYQDGELIIPTAITNQGTQSVILVTVNISVFNAQGELLTQQEVTVWQSIKRMADTYLRPKQMEQGRRIKLDLEQHPEYQIEAEITEVKTR